MKYYVLCMLEILFAMTKITDKVSTIVLVERKLNKKIFSNIYKQSADIYNFHFKIF